MPSNYTQNYQLNQWSADDRVQRGDFNADNAKIDAALAGLQSAVGTIPKIAVGHYAGNDAESRTISVGFTPKAVFVSTVAGFNYIIGDGYAPSCAYGGLAVTDHPCNAVQIVAGGFKVFKGTYVSSNGNNQNYNYIAIG